MNIAETLRGLLRRWYIVMPGLLLAAAAAAYVWTQLPPTYQRSASQLLIPAEATLPEIEIRVEGDEDEVQTVAPNPFLYLGGLNTAADVLVSAVRGAPSVAEALERYDGAELEVARDPMSSGPMLLVTVTAPTDEAAATLIRIMLDETTRVLDELQTTQHVPDTSRVLISPIAVDSESTLGNRERMTMAGAAGVGIAVLSILLAAAVDGLVQRRRGRVASHSRRSRTAEGRRGAHKPEGGRGPRKPERRRTAPTVTDEEPAAHAGDDIEAAIDRMLARPERRRDARGAGADAEASDADGVVDDTEPPADADAVPVGARAVSGR
jgi:hypothetical protein